MALDQVVRVNPRAPCAEQTLQVCKFVRNFNEIFRTVPTDSKVFLPRFMIMQEMYILTSVIEINKENWE